MTYQEGNKYKLQADYYESIILTCTYVEDNTAYFKLSGDDESLGSDYKIDMKRGKFYKWSSRYCSWDTIEAYELTAYGSNDAVGQTSYESYRVI